jgi:hypothetical protein
MDIGSRSRPQQEQELEGFVYRVAGPGGEGEMWIARTVTGQVAHGRTRDGAVERLRACVEALALSAGKSPGSWRDAQRVSDSVQLLRRRELLQA